jgi:hypothetical protein
VRLRKADLRTRVNADYAFRFDARALTSYAGLELVRRYFRTLDLATILRRHLDGRLPGTDFGVVSLVLLLLALMITGGRRIRHLLFLEGDPLVLRLCGLRRLPSARTVGRWLAQMTCKTLAALHRVNEEVAARAIERAGISRLTIDIDGTVVSTGLQVERAQRGYNPHHRKVPSYYPITAYEAGSGQILRVLNRSGNVHDGKASIGFLRDLFAQIRATLPGRRAIEFRMDGAFFRRDVINLIEGKKAEYAIKVPFYRWVGLRELIRNNHVWDRVADGIDCFEEDIMLGPWNRCLRVVIYRKRVGHKSPKNYQLDLFDPSDGHWEYSAVVTNKTLTGRNLWYYMCGRGGHEKILAELKGGYAFDCIPTMKYAANGAWQILNVLAFNLMRGMQATTTAVTREIGRSRNCGYVFETIQTIRYTWLRRAGIVARPSGRAVLDVGNNDAVRLRFERIADRLAEAA